MSKNNKNHNHNKGVKLPINKTEEIPIASKVPVTETPTPAKSVTLIENNSIITPIVIIPAEIHNRINYFCNQMRGTEWSGELFYEVEGTFNVDLRLVIKDILLLNLGGTASTEYDNDDMDIASYTFERQLMHCQRGLIHSHHSMGAFFSGTDTATLLDQGQDRIHFLSLIIDDMSTYQAALTVKLEVENIVKTISKKKHSFKTFFDKLISGNNDTEKEEIINSVQIQYKKCDIIYENQDRIDDWNQAITHMKSKIVKPTNPVYKFNSYNFAKSWENNSIDRWNQIHSKGTNVDLKQLNSEIFQQLNDSEHLPTKNILTTPTTDGIKATPKSLSINTNMNTKTLLSEGSLSVLVKDDILLLDSLAQEILEKLLSGSIFPVTVRANKDEFYIESIEWQQKYFDNEIDYENTITPLVDTLLDRVVEDFETEVDQSFIMSELYNDSEIQTYVSLKIIETIRDYVGQGYMNVLIKALSNYNIYYYDYHE